MSRFGSFPSLCFLLAMLLAVVYGPPMLVAQEPAAADSPGAHEARWWKGNLHTHSLWSDGDDFPEMIAAWYKKEGYHFLALTDHNVLSRGDRWMELTKIQARGGQQVFTKYLEAFGPDWVESRENEAGEIEVRLKPLDEFRGLLEQQDKYLLIEGEEISDSVNQLPVHLNATNLQEVLQPAGGSSVREAIERNLRIAAEQAKVTGRPILVHLNHPNFGWAITAEDIAFATEDRFFEVFNAHPSVNQNGDAWHPSIERMWDIVNTLRIDRLNSAPVFGLGTDDSHKFHGAPGSHPGRAWVMVKAPELSARSLISAMYRGDFYASSGVTLKSVRFDQPSKTLALEIEGQAGVNYQTRFIGTRRDYDRESTPQKNQEGQNIRSTRQYSSDVGEILKTDSSLTPAYEMTGDELYVRAIVVSDKPHPDPSFDNQFERAWTQPVGWNLK